MSKSNYTFANMSPSEWSDVMKGAPLEPFDKVEVTSGSNITSVLFVNTVKEDKKKTELQIVIETLVMSDQPFKYIVMGRDDEYQELANYSLRPFGTIVEAIAYGEQLTMRNSRGYSLYHSFVIQPLLKDMNSFQLTSEQIGMIRDIEKGVA